MVFKNFIFIKLYKYKKIFQFNKIKYDYLNLISNLLYSKFVINIHLIANLLCLINSEAINQRSSVNSEAINWIWFKLDIINSKFAMFD